MLDGALAPMTRALRAANHQRRQLTLGHSHGGSSTRLAPDSWWHTSSFMTGVQLID
jgi:hypothetical protein